MINIDNIELLTSKHIELRVKEFEKKCKKQQQTIKNTRQTNIRKALKAKKNAEAEFPKLLKTIEEEIIAAVTKNQHQIEVEIKNSSYGDDNLETIYLMGMIFAVLPISGFVCKINYYRSEVTVSW